MIKKILSLAIFAGILLLSLGFVSAYGSYDDYCHSSSPFYEAPVHHQIHGPYYDDRIIIAPSYHTSYFQAKSYPSYEKRYVQLDVIEYHAPTSHRLYSLY